MAIQSMLIDPAAGGVSQAAFDAHTHDYRRVDQIGVDDVAAYSSPNTTAIVDDTEVVAAEQGRVRSIGVTVSTQQTGAPT